MGEEVTRVSTDVYNLEKLLASTLLGSLLLRSLSCLPTSARSLAPSALTRFAGYGVSPVFLCSSALSYPRWSVPSPFFFLPLGRGPAAHRLGC